MKGSGIGGQAVMEGVMMKNGSKYAVAVRKPDGDIVVDTQKFKKTFEGVKFFDLPIARGVIAFIDSLRLGVGTLMYSADFAVDEEDEAKKKKDPEKQKREDKVIMTLSVVLAVVLAIGIFMVLPYYLSQLLKKAITSTALLTLCEGLIRIVLFVGYIAAISCMKDIKRVFMYHGAEHKSINCIENGLELNVANVRKSSRRHKRCGTSFLLIVMLISVIFFMFIRVETAWLRIVLRLLLIPVIAGVSYEFIRLAGKSDSKIVNILSKPGLALQSLTTSEPDDSMIEVAIASVEAVFDWREFLDNYDKTEGICELTGKTVNDKTASTDTKEGSAKKNAGKTAGDQYKNKNQGKNKGNKNHNKGNSQNQSKNKNDKRPDNSIKQEKNAESSDQDKQDKQNQQNKHNNNRNNADLRKQENRRSEDRNKPDNAGTDDKKKQPDSGKPEDQKIQANDAKTEDQKKRVENEMPEFLKKQEKNKTSEAQKKSEENENTQRHGEFEKEIKADKAADSESNTEKQTGNEARSAGSIQGTRRLTRSERLRGLKTVEPVTEDEDDDFLKALDHYFDDKKDES